MTRFYLDLPRRLKVFFVSFIYSLYHPCPKARRDIEGDGGRLPDSLGGPPTLCAPILGALELSDVLGEPGTL